ncbi:hypothetical protein RJ40_02385 [Methanofollis aquaemaris]|uniref:Uncharacterized protein n=1 Tax=Methanofollis aquaemaris TaxID=126734 RepID=A0A8A3S2Q3_9EURY|nr:hypothetical protein [Methanofollis aquaemaris]QSZ66425.1 hypothetical protein RJ40_02385 [Methanofollis aquaemaris]
MILDITEPNAGGWINVTGIGPGWSLVPDLSWWPFFWPVLGFIVGLLIGLHFAGIVRAVLKH